MSLRALVLLPLVGVLSVAGCSNNPNPSFATKYGDQNVASVKRVSGSPTDAVEVCAAVGGTVFGLDDDQDDLAIIPTMSDIFADNAEGFAEYVCIDLTISGGPKHYIKITSNSMIGMDCGDDPAMGGAEIGSADTPAYVDSDNDGLGTGESMMVCGTGEGTGYSTVDGDCDDMDPMVGAPGEVVYSDFDRDGYGAGSSFLSCTVEMGQATVGGDCDDLNEDTNPDAIEVCDDLDNNCDTMVDNDPVDGMWAYTDADSDGFGGPEYVGLFCELPEGTASNDTDCDDDDWAAKPGVAFHDSSTACMLDLDEDGYGDDDPLNEAVTPGTDCDDASAGVNPGVTEMTGNSIDDDCNASTSDAAPAADVDGDGYTSDVDCNDSLASIHPGATETCNGIDDDCDGSVDDGVTMTVYLDMDADGYGNAATAASACAASAGWVADSTDCNDASAGINPGATETCNSVDDDCDGMVDDGLATAAYYLDADGDGYGTSSSSIVSCSMPGGYSAVSTDCNDGSAAVNPGATEVSFDGIDNNCDGLANTTASAAITVTPNADQAGVSWELWLRDLNNDPTGGSTATWASGGAASGTGPLTGTVTVTNGHVEKLNGPMNGGGYWAAQTTGLNVSATVTLNGYSFVATNTCWDGTAWDRVGCPGTDLELPINTQ